MKRIDGNKPADAKFVYHITDVLMMSVPERFRDEIRTEVLNKGLRFLGRECNEVFIIMRNRKIDMLRKFKNRSNLYRSVEVPENLSKEDERYHRYRAVEGLEILYTAFLRLEERYQALTRGIIKYAITEGEVNFTRIAKKLKVSKMSVRKHYKRYLALCYEVRAEGRFHELHRMSSVSDLYRLLYPQSEG